MVLYRPSSYDTPSRAGTYLFDRGPLHSPRFHQGVDWPTPNGTPLLASGTGTVTETGDTGRSGGLGRYVRVAYDGSYVVTTAHHSRIDVVRNQRVTLGTQLGLSGGIAGAIGAGAATGPHVHTELALKGVRIDPMNLTPRSAILAGGDPIEIGDDDMPTAAEIAEAVWVYQLGNKGGGPGAVFGRATDWVTNSSDKLAVVETKVNGLSKTIADDVNSHAKTNTDSILAAVKAIVPGNTTVNADLTPILDALRGLPTETVAAIKAAL